MVTHHVLLLWSKSNIMGLMFHLSLAIGLMQDRRFLSTDSCVFVVCICFSAWWFLVISFWCVTIRIVDTLYEYCQPHCKLMVVVAFGILLNVIVCIFGGWARRLDPFWILYGYYSMGHFCWQCTDSVIVSSLGLMLF